MRARSSWSTGCRANVARCRQPESRRACRTSSPRFRRGSLSDNTFELSTLDEVIAHFRERAGFVWAPWCGDAECEAKIKADTSGVTIRTIDSDEHTSELQSLAYLVCRLLLEKKNK